MFFLRGVSSQLNALIDYLGLFLPKDDNLKADLMRLFSYRFIFRQNILKFDNLLTYPSSFREQT